MWFGLIYKDIKCNEKYRKRAYLKVIHTACNTVFFTPISKIKGNKLNCPKCVYRKKDHETFLKEFNKTANNEYELISEYKNVSEKVLVKHIRCGHTYEVTPNKWLNGRRCPYCNVSKGEEEIKKFLQSEGISFKQQVKFDNCKDKLKLPFDFAVYDADRLLFLIEFDGWHHFSFKPNARYNKTIEDLKLVQYHDKIKDEFCIKNSIKLLRINNIKDIEKSIRKMFNDYPDRE